MVSQRRRVLVQLGQLADVGRKPTHGISNSDAGMPTSWSIRTLNTETASPSSTPYLARIWQQIGTAIAKQIERARIASRRSTTSSFEGMNRALETYHAARLSCGLDLKAIHAVLPHGLVSDPLIPQAR